MPKAFIMEILRIHKTWSHLQMPSWEESAKIMFTKFTAVPTFLDAAETKTDRPDKSNFCTEFNQDAVGHRAAMVFWEGRVKK